MAGMSQNSPPIGPLTEKPLVRRLLIGLALLVVGLFLVMPLAVVFVGATAEGVATYREVLADPAGRSAIKLTLIAAAFSVPVNLTFGIAAAWCVTRYRFPLRGLLITLIDLPFSVSPVISGLVFVLLFGAQSVLGGWLVAHGFPVIFAVPGIVIATLFITLPFVARELIPLMESLGHDEELAALTLGASGWQILRRVTLPRVRWGLLYGVILCNARAMGEFGAVSVVSGHVRGRTNTLPLHIEILYNEYETAAAFAAASLLALLAIVTLVVKVALESAIARQLARSTPTAALPAAMESK
jgi:sulfate transport system permease protein